MRSVTIAVLICLVFAIEVAGQTLVRCEVGNYQLTYTDDLGGTYTIEIASPARIRPQLGVVLVEHDGLIE